MPHISDYNFSELKDNIVGEISNMFGRMKFVMYGHVACQHGDMVKCNDGTYRCTHSYDITTSEESDEGLSYSQIELEKEEEY